MEAGILPGDRILSYCVSLGAGLGSALLLFAVESPIAILGQRLFQIHWSLMFGLQVSNMYFCIFRSLRF